MRKDNKKIVSGAAVLGAGAFLAKAIGAIYRVPLTALIGSDGLGLYQMVFPVYVVLLELSGAGVPNALSKIIAGENETPFAARSYLKTALKFFAALGLIASVLMAVFAKPFSALQGDGRASFSYVALAPSVFFVCLISCFRGYFQGQMKMSPTAFSQVAEQVVKLICGLTFSYLFMPDVTLAAAGAAFAVTLSEAAAFSGLLVCYKKSAKNELPAFKYDKKRFRPELKTVIRYVVPITLVGIVLPLSQVADSFMIINFLSVYSENPTALFGLFSGVAMTIINLPVSVCYGIAAIAVPSVSGAKEESEKRKNSARCICLTLAVSVPAAILCYAFAPLALKILFGRLSEGDRAVAAELIRMLSVTVVLASLLQTCNAILIGKGKLYLPAVGVAAGVAAKIVLTAILVRNPQINIYGGAVALIACYFVADLINLIAVFAQGRIKESYENKTARVGEIDCR